MIMKITSNSDVCSPSLPFARPMTSSITRAASTACTNGEATRDEHQL